MPEAKFQIKRKCEICGAPFIAKTLTKVVFHANNK